MTYKMITSWWICLVLVIRPSSCHPTAKGLALPNLESAPPHAINDLSIQKGNQNGQRFGVEDIEAIIEDVQKIISKNPNLPRLTRGEIIDLLENITKSDLEDAFKKNRDAKALMLVMPFTPSNSSESNMEEFYTKRPITHIVGGEAKQQSEEKKKVIRRKPILRTKPVEEIIGQKKVDVKPSLEDYVNFKRLPDKMHKFEDMSLPVLHTSERSPFTSSPSTTEIPAVSESVETTTKGATTYIGKVPLRKRKPQTTTEVPNLEVKGVTKKYSVRRKKPTEKRITTTSKYEEPNSNSGIHIIDPPQFKPQPPRHFEDDQVPVLNINDFLSSKEEINSNKQTLDNLGVPENMKNAVRDIDILMVDPNFGKYTNQYQKPSSYSKPKQELQQNKFLAFAGVPFYTTTTEMPDVSMVANNLSPDMQDLLMRFGLIPSPKASKKVEEKPQPKSSFTPELIPIQPESYTNFKPLPDTDKAQDDMLEFLSQFGLTGSNRNKKAMRTSNDKNNLQTEEKKPKTDLKIDDNIPEESEIVEKHVFNPSNGYNATLDELERLNKLMDAIKELERLNGTATEEDLKHIDIEGLKDLVLSLNQAEAKPLTQTATLDQQSAPDPTNYDFGLSKNEVKRQQSTTKAPTDEDEAKKANLEALAESFGGPSSAAQVVTEPPVVETTPTSRRSGFYYLLDWNSFFDLDNQKGKRVNLRFQPKVGDPKRFYSVTVP